jgi:hypothetical protein
MRTVLVLGLAAAIALGAGYAFWRHRLNSTCPAIERLTVESAAGNARRAFGSGDHRLLMIGAFVGTVPGAIGEAQNPVLVEGTGDTVSEACRILRPKAEAYALAYNQTIVRLRRSP